MERQPQSRITERMQDIDNLLRDQRVRITWLRDSGTSWLSMRSAASVARLALRCAHWTLWNWRGYLPFRPRISALTATSASQSAQSTPWRSRRSHHLPDRIVFLDCSLSSMICAHMILDASRDADVHMVTDRFEVGMYGEAPGIISESVWPIARDHWLSKTGFNHPGAGDTAIRSSWMKKSMAISLADRGAHFHTGTHTTEESTEGKEVTLSYPGGKTTTRIMQIAGTDDSGICAWLVKS